MFRYLWFIWADKMINIADLNTKDQVFQKVNDFLEKNSINIVSINKQKPWGGYFVIKLSDTECFIKLFFPELSFSSSLKEESLSPKILIVAPGVRLSWQYHLRRAEIWTLVGGKAGVVYSDTDMEGTQHILKSGETINLKQGERHRLLGLDTFGIIAEIWQHTDPSNPSNEEDIVRVQDDFGR
ncbi:hypothetical protein BH09BAC2_BH09BAC2_05090 [soil metagenome]